MRFCAQRTPMHELARLRTRCRELVRDVLRGCGEPQLEDLVLPASLPRGLGLGLGPGTDPSLGLGVSRSVASSSTTSARSCVKRLVMATRRRTAPSPCSLMLMRPPSLSSLSSSSSSVLAASGWDARCSSRLGAGDRRRTQHRRAPYHTAGPNRRRRARACL